MRRITSILILAMATSAAWAQSPATPVSTAKGAAAQMNKNTAQTNAAVAASSTVKPATAPPAKQAKPTAAAKQVAKPATPAPAAASAPAPAASEPAEAAPAISNNAKKRDPFVSPIVNRVGGPVGCSGGKKCLVVDQIALKGVVRSQNGMIAVIVNAANKAYFMRESDSVYNGFVVKITPDSIVFRETVTDRLGKALTREVVKKVNAPVV